MSDMTATLIAALITVIGLVVGVTALFDAVHEWRVARRYGKKTVRCLYARSTVRSQALRMSKLAAFGTMVMVALIGLENRRFINIILLLYVIGASSTDAILDRVVSHRIINQLREQVEKTEQERIRRASEDEDKEH